MGKIDYKAIYDTNKEDWKALTENPQKYEALLAGHYSDSNHFVYELLQNAEDERASKVVIELYNDKLVFYHNGSPFDESDVKGVSSMLMGTKDREDAQTIGRFGMGFKSVFKYTYQPEIYSDYEAFKITRYLLPEELHVDWNYEIEKSKIACNLGEGGVVYPFKDEEHLTKIVIPFLKFAKDGSIEPVSGQDVLYKLQGLDGQILLFLNYIKSVYWVDKDKGGFALITKETKSEDENVITCNIASSSKEDVISSKYLKYKKIFDHPEMKNAEVSVAYKLNSRGDNINVVEYSPIWVYFPTRDSTQLPFLIHGSFETAVSREKLMSPSKFNDDLFDELGNLIADAMCNLAERKLITHGFLRRIVLEAFDDEEYKNTIPGLEEKITEVIKKNGLLPDRDGIYRKPEDLNLAVPFRISDYVDNAVVDKAFVGTKPFVIFNSETAEPNFIDYFMWLKEDFGINVYTLSSLAKDLSKLQGMNLSDLNSKSEALIEFYRFLSDYSEATYLDNRSVARKRAYEKVIIDDIGYAWDLLRKAPIVLNAENKLVPAQVNNKPNIYLAASSDYKKVSQGALVNPLISVEFKSLLSNGFKIPEFDDFQYVKEKVVQKYRVVAIGKVFNTSEITDSEYIDDLNQIFALLEKSGDIAAIREMVSEANIIRIEHDHTNGTANYVKPRDCFALQSEEGINQEIYFKKSEKDSDPPVGFSWMRKEPLCFMMDKAFYEDNGISSLQLEKLGLINSPVHDGIRMEERRGSRRQWCALGDYCPNISIDYLFENLIYIEENPENDLAKEKSVEIYKLCIKIWKKLSGRIRVGVKDSLETEVEESGVLKLLKSRKWLFGKDVRNYAPTEMSKYELNQPLYGELISDKKMYEVLGFIEKETDEALDTFEQVSNLNHTDKMILLRQLARELGKEVEDSRTSDDSWDYEASDTDTFNPSTWVDDAFPTSRIRNMDYLVRHVKEQFYFADPVIYKMVLRQVRVSKDSASDKAYVLSMYTNLSNVTICQICRKPVAFFEVDQIANFGIEMPQLNLCLCRECAAKYKSLRDKEKAAFKDSISQKISDVNVMELADDYVIRISSDVDVHFTQTHIAEVKEILKLLDEYGAPTEDQDENYGDNFVEEINDITVADSKPNHNEEHIDNVEQYRIDKPDRLNDKEKREDVKQGKRLNLWGMWQMSSQEMLAETTDAEDSDNREETTNGIDDGIAGEGCVISYQRGKAPIVSNIVLTPKTHALHRMFVGHKAGDIVKFNGNEYRIIEVKRS